VKSEEEGEIQREKLRRNEDADERVKKNGGYRGKT
jgi:hypothetical protein